MRVRVSISCLCGLLTLAGLPAAAQQTREEFLRNERQKRSQALTTYQPGTVERIALKIENDRILERLFVPTDGFDPRIGSFTRGGGIAIGGGYVNRNLFAGRLAFQAGAAVSAKKYVLADAQIRLPRLARGRGEFALTARRRDFPEEDFFGLGADSLRPNRVSYAYRDTEIDGVYRHRIARWLTGSAGLAYVSPSIGRGRDPRFPSVEDLFSVATTPGLDAQPDFLRYSAGLDVDYGEPAGNPRAGGRYIVRYTHYDDRDFGRYSFGRLDLDLRQYLSILRERRVLALRAYLSTTEASGDNRAPFYYQATLGGSDSLRGFREFRFRDEHLMLLQAEYRWEVFPALDAALFYDTGKVASRRRDLDFDKLERAYGFGFRFGTFRGVFLRVDAAFGSRDGKRYWLRFGHVF